MRGPFFCEDGMLIAIVFIKFVKHSTSLKLFSTMKYLAYLLMFVPSALLGMLPPSQSAPLYDHLYEVNQQWAHVQHDSALSLSHEVAFESDIDRIAMHLYMVEQLLKSSSDHWSDKLKIKRTKLLETLAVYREVKRFPVNHYHEFRSPYFIDNHGTVCAVGHLMITSGYSALAEQIANENNYAYVLEMEYEELPFWASEHGFTIQELALIQPGYAPPFTWSPLGTGADGNVTCLHTDEVNNRLIVAGKFSELNGVKANRVGYYRDGFFYSLGDGINGEIIDIEVLGDTIFLGGLFDDSTNIAKWDGANWSLSTISSGKVHALKVYGGVLRAGGDFSGLSSSGTQVNYIAQLDQGQWKRFGETYGPVYAIEEHQEGLYLGGNFMPGSFTYHVAKYETPATWSEWVPAALPLNRLNYTVTSLASDGTYLYATGSCQDNNAMRYCLSRLGNSGWEALFREPWISYEGLGFQQVITNKNDVYLVGDFINVPLIGTTGACVGKLEFKLGRSGLEPRMGLMAVIDSTVLTIAEYQGALFIGGKFPFWNHLAKTDLPTGNAPSLAEAISIYPNPTQGKVQGNIEQGRRISQINVYDLNGRKQQVSPLISSNQFSFTLQGASPGMYFVEVQVNGEMYSKTKLLITQ